MECWRVNSHLNYKKVMFEKHLGNCGAENQTNLTVYFLNWRFTSTEKKQIKKRKNGSCPKKWEQKLENKKESLSSPTQDVAGSLLL